MITERKAIQEMFEDLQRERKELKANYREDLVRLEQRQDSLLTRLERLDGIEREAIDPEGLLQQMAATMDKMATYIPDIPAGALLDAAAEKMAAAAQQDDAPIIYSEKAAPFIKEKPKTLLDYSKKHISHNEMTYKIEDVIQEIENFLEKNGISTSKELEQHLKDSFGWEWKAFSNNLNNWRKKYSQRIIREGYRYTLANEGEEAHGQTNKSAPETTA